MNQSQWVSWIIKPIVFAICLTPMLLFIWRIQFQGLPEEPVKAIIHFTGDWTLRFLLITLSVTPIRQIFSLPQLLRFRRTLGLYVFYYACLHFSIYLLDQSFTWSIIVEDVIKHPYVTVGFSCFVLLVPMALTSNMTMVRKLGSRRWQRLHYLIYLIAIGGVVHFFWLVKKDLSEPAYYAIILAVLLFYRAYIKIKSTRNQLIT